jgi:hypothetical protein
VYRLNRGITSSTGVCINELKRQSVDGGPRDTLAGRKNKTLKGHNRKKEIKETVIMACKHDDDDRR